MNRDELKGQTKLAFDFVQKLYLEVSYLIKELDGLFSQEEDKFNMLRPSGYNITARSSNGLDPNFVHYWLMRKISIAFSKPETSPVIKGQSITKILPETKIIYMRIVLDDKDIHEPMIYCAVLYDFYKKNPLTKWPMKIEQLMAHFEYNEAKVFSNPKVINYEDSYVQFKGRMFNVALYDIETSDAIHEKIIQPALKLFHQVKPD
jgi:hypothetical protein